MSGYGYTLLGSLWRTVKLVLWVVGIGLAFVALVECLQAYQALSLVHPLLGWAFLVVLLGAVAFGIVYYVVAMARRPAVLIPPPRQDLASASPRELRHCARYLAGVLERLAGNALVPETQRSGLRAEAAKLKSRTSRQQDGGELISELERVVDEVIMPAVAPLDAEAERQVRACVRDTMVGVAVSPWRSIDLFVVLYRAGRMVMDVSATYNGRPRLREQVRIMADVLKIAATVQFLNIGSKLMENLTSWIPVLGRFTDDIAQGLGAGLFTSVAGHATIDRCRTFHGWSEEEARNNMAARLKDFMQDLKGVVSDLVVPALEGRIEAELPEEKRTPNLTERIKAGIGEAIDATSETVDSCVRQPVLVGYKGVSSTGAVLWRGTKRASAGAGRAAVWTGHHGWRLSSAGVKAAGKGAAKAGRGAAAAVKGIVRSVRRSDNHQE
jgi:uncharacterized membrane protein YcjF (UPF0283 family)